MLAQIKSHQSNDNQLPHSTKPELRATFIFFLLSAWHTNWRTFFCFVLQALEEIKSHILSLDVQFAYFLLVRVCVCVFERQQRKNYFRML